MASNNQIKRPVLRYHGGKFKLADWIISHFPKHRIYTEPFGGGGSVLLKKPRSYAEVYNDKWDVVVNVFQVLRDPEKSLQLQRALILTPFSRTEFDNASNMSNISCDVELARLTILRSFAGFGSAATNGKHSTGFRSNCHRDGTTPAQDWANYPSCIPAFVERLRGVVIENRDYYEIINQHDAPDTLHFLDPPYLHGTRNFERANAAYEHEMSDDDHRLMCERILNVQGYVILSGYDNDIYNQILKNWTKVRRSTYADGASKRIECLWLNPKCSKSQQTKLDL